VEADMKSAETKELPNGEHPEPLRLRILCGAGLHVRMPEPEDRAA
jgi:hypothetical protein